MSFFFLKQKTAYELRISDWSSDVCSSDLPQHRAVRTRWGAVTRILSRSLEISQRSLIVALAGRAPLAILKIVMSDRIECARCWSYYSLSCHTTALGWIKTEELYMTEQFSVRPIGGGMSELLYDEGLRRHMLQVDRKSTRLNSSH